MTRELPALPAHRSLRTKGWVATLALLAYLAMAGAYIATQREGIYDSMRSLEALSEHEKALALADAAVAGALVDVTDAGSAGNPAVASLADLRMYMESCERLFVALERFDTGYARIQRSVQRSWGELQARPDRANWIDLREALGRASDELDIRRRVLAERRGSLLGSYQRQHDSVTVQSLLLGTLGLVAFGTLAAWFFGRLSRDIRLLEAHARQIVRGRRGVELPVGRDDELGHLMHAVNQMSSDLDERERRIQLDAGRHAQEEKMLAVGALAAGVAHEVNNPLMVIGGLAQELAAGAAPERVSEAAALILAQTQRAANSARQLAEVSAPRSGDLDWLDLNALLRDAIRLTGYDRRYRQLRFDVALDPGLPALRSSGGAVQLALLQLLGLVGDAMAARPDAVPELRVETGMADGNLQLRLLCAPVLDFMRPEAQRALLLTRAIVEPLGGRLALGQTDAGRQAIKLQLPTEPVGTILH